MSDLATLFHREQAALHVLPTYSLPHILSIHSAMRLSKGVQQSDPEQPKHVKLLASWMKWGQGISLSCKHCTSAGPDGGRLTR